VYEGEDERDGEEGEREGNRAMERERYGAMECRGRGKEREGSNGAHHCVQRV
jgi:hypothetical protein